MPAQLVERGALLDQLRRELAGARRGQGRLVFVTGEAGMGKTALLQAFRAQTEGAVSVLWGNCDSVVPARPFAPVADIAVQVGGALRRALDSANRDRIFEAFLELIRARPSGATVGLTGRHPGTTPRLSATPACSRIESTPNCWSCTRASAS